MGESYAKELAKLTAFTWQKSTNTELFSYFWANLKEDVKNVYVRVATALRERRWAFSSTS